MYICVHIIHILACHAMPTGIEHLETGREMKRTFHIWTDMQHYADTGPCTGRSFGST